jgi:hypothetical protein
MSSYDHAAPTDGNVVLYRLGELASQVRALIKWRGEVDVERERLRNDAKSLATEMVELKQAVDTLRKTILGFALTIAVSAVVFALTVLSSAGKI